ncbi:MAG TPA: twin-arginine translocase TatA/TatE family subunit [Gammaproteobacteria bacterium]|nr:twin-arginine translocase TatA/TatE family subunit [Gammaproteobacteria bacterium]
MHLSELLVILLVALLVINPKQIPDIALKAGRLIKWLRLTAEKIKREIDIHE